MHYLKPTPPWGSHYYNHVIHVESKVPLNLKHLVPHSTDHFHLAVLEPRAGCPQISHNGSLIMFDFKLRDKQPVQEGHVDPFLSPWMQETHLPCAGCPYSSRAGETPLSPELRNPGQKAYTNPCRSFINLLHKPNCAESSLMSTHT